MSRPRPLPLAALVLSVLALLAAVASLTVGSERRRVEPPAPATTSASPSPTPVSVTPSASPTPSASRASAVTTAEPTAAGPDESLARNSLYDVDLSGVQGTCPDTVRSPKPPIKNAKLAAYLRSLAACLTDTFDEPLAAQGFSLAAPSVETYAKTVSTPCGKFDQRQAPAYYCPSTQTIYWPVTSDDGTQAFTFARLGYVALLAHEYGHHLQATTGMLVEYGERIQTMTKKGSRELMSRRLELQAQCFEGVFLAVAARALKLTPDDRAQLRTWHGYTGDEDPPASRSPDHGTSAAQIRWLERGLDTADFGRCNTWTASPSAVR